MGRNAPFVTTEFESSDAGLIGRLEPRSRGGSDDSAGADLVMSLESRWLATCAGIYEFTEAGLIGRLESRSVGELVGCLGGDWLVAFAGAIASVEAALIGNCELSNETDPNGLTEGGAVLVGFGGICSTVPGTGTEFVDAGLMGNLELSRDSAESDGLGSVCFASTGGVNG